MWCGGGLAPPSARLTPVHASCRAQVAASAFFSASPHPIVADIQHGKIETPNSLPAMAQAQKLEAERQREEASSREPPGPPSWHAAEEGVECASSAGKITVLSVDDDYVNQRVVNQILRSVHGEHHAARPPQQPRAPPGCVVVY